jgi:hypothetical protein
MRQLSSSWDLQNAPIEHRGGTNSSALVVHGAFTECLHPSIPPARPVHPVLKLLASSVVYAMDGRVARYTVFQESIVSFHFFYAYLRPLLLRLLIDDLWTS